MKKKTIIITFTILFSAVLLLLLAYRIYLITLDVSGVYVIKNNDLFNIFMNYMPETSLVVTVITIHLRKKWGLAFSVIACVCSVLSLVSELVIFIARSIDGVIPAACQPLLNIPVMIVCLILFIIKFKIYTIPKKVVLK